MSSDDTNSRSGGPLPADDAWSRPPGVDDATVEACGTLGEALEWLERARGHLYEFHQLMGRADLLFGDAAHQLADAGHRELARFVESEVVGRNVLAGRWTFQVVEEFDEGYWAPVREVEGHVRGELMGGRRHVFEAEMKERRRTQGRDRHERRPTDEPAAPG
ncbi:MAG TPA: hypothetical protein VF743_06115 [Acidimicrobiales bacterium]